MTLPSSGVMSLAMIAGEFGGSPPHALNEYYRGGALVPNIAENANIPTSGQISLGQFYGAKASSGFSVTRTGQAEIHLLHVGTGNVPLSGETAFSAVGGTGSYSYNTVWASGGSGITITNVTASNPGVTATRGSPRPVFLSGVMRTTVTSGSETRVFDTPVSLSWEV